MAIIVKLKQNVRYTNNFLGTIEELQKARLVAIDRSADGSRLCLCDDRYLVDVDFRDIAKIIEEFA